MRKYGWEVAALFLAAAMALGGCGGVQKENEQQETEDLQATVDLQGSAASEEETDVDESVNVQADQEEAESEQTPEEETDKPSESEPEEAESGIIIPEVSIGWDSIPDLAALEFVKNMKVGWNLGNTLDAYIGSGNAGLKSEQCWGNPVTTKEMVAAVKETGFETIRIPVTWHNHLEREEGSSRFTISSEWMDRVQEVVDYAYDNEMYVILNIHHDTAEDVYYPDSAHYEQSENYIRTVWEAIAERFKDYDRHLIFESMNEPRLVGNSFEWNFQDLSQECKDSADCINKLNQVFVDTVRASGGNNGDRYLMVPGYAASLAGVSTNLFVLPADSADNKLIVSVHAYTPYNFALRPQSEGGATDRFPAEGGSGRSDIDYVVNTLYQKFVSRGIPVVIGEYGALNKNNNLQDRVNYYAYFVAAARAKGIICCVWDNGIFSGDGELFGVLNRQKCEWAYPEVVQAIMKYA